MRFTKVVGVTFFLIVVTGLIELFFPGATIIPGWIGLPEVKGRGSLTFRIEGIRLGGAVGGHNILSDMAMIGLLFMVFADRRGRRLPFLLAFSLMPVANLATAFAPDPITFTVAQSGARISVIAVAGLAIGALAAWAWPIVILFWLGRRAKQRRDDKMRAEVERQINEQNRG